MSELGAVGLTVAVALAAACAVAVHPTVIAVVVGLALVPRLRGPALVLAAVMCVSTLAARAEAGVGVIEVSDAYDGRAQLVSDPQRATYGRTVELRLHDGRRVWATGDRATTAALSDMRMGQRVEVQGRLQPMDAPPGWMRSRHFAGRLVITSVRHLDDGPLLWRSANSLQRITTAGMRPLDADQQALYRGVVFGDDRDQSEVQQYAFRASGIAHLLAVSGQNVALVLALAAPLLSRSTRTPRVVIAAGIVVWFAVLTRLEPSVLRAVAMVLIASSAWWHGRFVSGRRILCLAIIVLLAIDPMLIWSLGFQLSVAACVGIIELARPLAEVLPGPRWIAQPLAVALAAQAFTAPLLLAIFGPTSLAAPLTNLVAVPIGGALMIWGALTGPVAGVLGTPTDSVVAVPAAVLLWLLDAAARSGSHPRVPRIGTVGVATVSFATLTPWLSAHRPGWLAARRVKLCGAAAVAVVSIDVVSYEWFGATEREPILVAERRGVQRWAVGSSHMMVLDNGATEASVLDVLVQSRTSENALVIVLGGGLRTSGAVLALRRVSEPGLVVARDPELVRDAGSLPVGPIELDGVRFALDETGRPTVDTSVVNYIRPHE